MNHYDILGGGTKGAGRGGARHYRTIFSTGRTKFVKSETYRTTLERSRTRFFTVRSTILRKCLAPPLACPFCPPPCDSMDISYALIRNATNRYESLRYLRGGDKRGRQGGGARHYRTQVVRNLRNLKQVSNISYDNSTKSRGTYILASDSEFHKQHTVQPEAGPDRALAGSGSGQASTSRGPPPSQRTLFERFRTKCCAGSLTITACVALGRTRSARGNQVWLRLLRSFVRPSV